MSASPRDKQPSPHQPGSAHSPPAHDPEAVAVSPANEEDAELPSQVSDEQDQQEQEQAPHPPFEPVFTLLTNTTTNATTHPRVHYIFSDDDPSILSNLDPSRRALLIDLVPSQPSASASPAPAWSVSWAASLSPDFALTSSRLTEQQHDASGASSDAMLRLEGVEREPVELRQAQQRMEDSDEEGYAALGRDQEDQEGLVEDFKRRMSVLQKVIDEAQKREVVVAGEFEPEDEEEDDEEEAVASGQKGDDEARNS